MAIGHRPQVQLLWWRGCPSTQGALEELRRVMRETGLDPDEVDMREIETDAQARDERFVGSPTVLIDGNEAQPTDGQPPGLTCRVYRLRDGRFSPTPDPADLRDAILQAMGRAA